MDIYLFWTANNVNIMHKNCFRANWRMMLMDDKIVICIQAQDMKTIVYMKQWWMDTLIELIFGRYEKFYLTFVVIWSGQKIQRSNANWHWFPLFKKHDQFFCKLFDSMKITFSNWIISVKMTYILLVLSITFKCSKKNM